MKMSNLSCELIVDILLRLPIKSLCRFKCISKPWCTLISHPNFVKTHLHRAQFKRLILATRNSLYSIDHETSFENDSQPDAYFVSNPATHETTQIPDALTPYGFDHAILGYGFGYAPSIDDYKLVKAVNAPPVAVFFAQKPKRGNWSRAFTTRSRLRGECVIAAFNLEFDMFREMSVLAISVSGFSTRFLDGCLCLMDSAFGRRHRDLWVMKEYGVGKS
ncbi:hypothetical protein RGQ29_032842 [Quercus rubra]|uniref:F-box domain-containing protein n=1 Tax=Quercus rubra TaxID=3512 RepID=A0AAN7DVG7_QUERU|nr:hypothetical protein RGQ29_032842 [Quercus rubra]